MLLCFVSSIPDAQHVDTALTIVVFGVVASIAVGYLLLGPGRRLVLFFGGLLFSAGTVGISSVEWGFLIVTGYIGIVAWLRTAPHQQERWLYRLRLASGIFIGVGAYAVAIGVLKTGSIFVPLRGAVPYLTLSVGILASIDAARNISRSKSRALSIATVAVVAVSFAPSFLAARGVATSISKPSLVAYPSLVIVGTGAAMLMAWQIAAPGRVVSGALAITILTAPVLITGTRTILAVGAGFAAALGSNVRRLSAMGRASASILTLGLSSGFLLVYAAPRVVDPNFLATRARSVEIILQGGIGADASGLGRIGRYEIAWHYFVANPVTGSGSGALYLEGSRLITYLDTPLFYLAQLGIVGTVLLLLGGYYLGSGLRTAAREVDCQHVFLGVVAFWLAALPFSAVTEDRGLGIAVALLILMVAARPPEPGDRMATQLAAERSTS